MVSAKLGIRSTSYKFRTPVWYISIMKIYITASSQFYDKVADIKSQLEEMGHKVTPPNGYGGSITEVDTRKFSPGMYQKWKAEMFKTFDLGKKIFLYNPIPESMLKDEIIGFGPVIINRDLTRIK